MRRGSLFSLVIVLVILLSSCKEFNNQARRIPLAKAGEKVLYYDQLPISVQQGMSPADSAAVVQNYINRWAKREILKQKAIQNLTPEFKTEVERQVEEMRTNLLIHQYQQQMISQKMDSVVTAAEIENYYVAKETSFVLNINIIKALFIRIPSDIPNLSQVAEWYRSNDPQDIAQLEAFCYQFADKFDDFDEQWIPFSILLAELPVTIDNQDDFLNRNSHFETEDSGYQYFVSIREYKVRGTVAPFEYVTNNIKSMILNSRRMEFLQGLETGVFSEAIRENIFTIYN